MAAITSAVIAVGTATYQIAQAEKAKKEAKKDIKDFKTQDLINPFKSVQISTLKSDQLTESNNQNLATTVEALRRTGTRGVLSGIPKINNSNILLQNLISSDLDRQDKERQLNIARGEERIRGIRENRESLALQGLGQKLQTARQDSATAIGSLISGGLAFASSTANAGGGGGSSTPFSDEFSLELDPLTIPQSNINSFGASNNSFGAGNSIFGS